MKNIGFWAGLILVLGFSAGHAAKSVVFEFDKCFSNLEKNEARGIEMNARYVERRDGALHIKTESGKVVVLRDDKVDNDRLSLHSFCGFAEDIGHHVVRWRGYEHGGLILVDGVSGKELFVSSTPELSPDRSRFVTRYFDIDMDPHNNTIEIGSIHKDGAEMDFRIRCQPFFKRAFVWGAAKVDWIDNDTLSVTREGFAYEPNFHDVLDMNKWIIKVTKKSVKIFEVVDGKRVPVKIPKGGLVPVKKKTK